jgi:hypothetical protein
MKTFYSILYALITPETSEKLSLGLMLGNGQQSLFRYSRPKLKVVGSLVSHTQHAFISNYLQSLVHISPSLSQDVDKPEFLFPEVAHSMISEKYIDYLSRYNQNVLSFGKPVNIDLPINDESLDLLFSTLINEKPKPVDYKHGLIKIKERLIPKAEKYYNIDREILPVEYPGLIMPVTVDFFGKNERPVYAQFFDFERALNHIKNDYFDLNQLQTVVENAKGFVVSAEPDSDKYSVQHEAWNAVRAIKTVEYLDISEIDKIEEYAIQHEVHPF